MNGWLLLLVPVAAWGGIRACLAGGKGWFESPAAARNRNIGRRRDPWRVQVISVVLFAVLLWWMFAGGGR